MKVKFGMGRLRVGHWFPVLAIVFPSLLVIAPWSSSALGQQVHWQDQRSPDAPGEGAVVGGPGDSPEPNSPLYVCRASYQGSTQPGKWVKGNCNVTYNSKEVVTRQYQVLYGQAEWRPYTGSTAGLLQTGNDADGTPIYSCRVQYKNHGYQPGKIYFDKCDIPYDGGEKGQHGPFDALYVSGSGSYAAASGGPAAPASPTHHGGLMSNLIANAQYQQPRQSGGDPDSMAPLNSQRKANGGGSGKKPLCKMSDSDVHLVDGTWAGPNCIAVNGDGTPAHPDEVKAQNDHPSQSDQEKRAADMESHSCMTTYGADKANELAADCQKVADHPDKACNIQQNSCDEIRKATQRGCWGKAAEGPDWCLTKYN